VKKFLIFFLLIFLSNCSLDSKSGLWTKSKIIEQKKPIIKEQFKKEPASKLEFNPKLKINLSEKLINNSFINNLDNNNGRINYNGTLKKASRFKFKKIHNFDQFEPEIVFNKNNVIFFDNKGSILKFNDQSKLIWKKNYYTKNEKKSKPILFFANNDNTLVVADSIAKFYAVKIDTGELLWSKNNSAPFNSQVKIYKNKFFVIDFENTLRCYSLKNGTEIWNIKTDQSLIKSQKKLSLIIVRDKIYFNNSLGDITAANINDGRIIWQSPTQSSTIYEDSFFLKTSDIIAGNNSILLSNNRNEFFSLDIRNGSLKWKQKVNSNLRPTLIENLVFSVTNEGFLVVIDNETGNIVRITNIFDRFKVRKIIKAFTKPIEIRVKPEGFIVGSKNIYLTTNNGRLVVIDIKSGKTTSILKLDNEKISRPFVLNQNLYIIKDNSIIKLD
jgi:outer membrane protein assembly factor BamB